MHSQAFYGEAEAAFKKSLKAEEWEGNLSTVRLYQVFLRSQRFAEEHKNELR